MPQKTSITNIAGVGIIYEEAYPANIFIGRKDKTHQIMLGRDQLCPIGGNWIGETAKGDLNPLETFRRELREEISFDRPIRSSKELAQMGMAEAKTFAPTPIGGIEITEEDREDLAKLKDVITRSATPFGDYLNTVPKAALDAADPTNKRDGFTTLASYYMVPLNNRNWERLEDLQHKFGNLSNESATLIVDLGTIVARNMKIAFAHDRVLKEFWIQMGFKPKAERLPLVPGLDSQLMSMPLSTYAAYLERYDVAKKPV